jgi:hypothetical protein
MLRLFLLFTQLGLLEDGKILVPGFYEKKNNRKSGELFGIRVELGKVHGCDGDSFGSGIREMFHSFSLSRFTTTSRLLFKFSITNQTSSLITSTTIAPLKF